MLTVLTTFVTLLLFASVVRSQSVSSLDQTSFARSPSILSSHEDLTLPLVENYPLYEAIQPTFEDPNGLIMPQFSLQNESSFSLPLFLLIALFFTKFSHLINTATTKQGRWMMSGLMTVGIMMSQVVPATLSACTSRLTIEDTNCIISSNQDVKCWGYNFVGQLGYGDVNYRGDNVNEMGNYLPIVNLVSTTIEVHAGDNHNCILSYSNQAMCWGDAGLGQLGYEDSIDRGDGSGEMGSYLPYVDIGSGIEASQLAVGLYHNIVLTSSDNIKAWGDAGYGQLGYGNVEDMGNEPGEMGGYLPYVDVGSTGTPMTISEGRFSSCVLFDDLAEKCWGYNGYGELGQGSTNNLGDVGGEMGDSLPNIQFPGGVSVSQMVSGWNHRGIISTTGDLWLWGQGANGALGIGSTLLIGDGPNEMGNYLSSTNVGSGLTVTSFSGA